MNSVAPKKMKNTSRVRSPPADSVAALCRSESASRFLRFM